MHFYGTINHSGLLESISIYSYRSIYGSCTENSYTKVTEKMATANSVDPDQTAPAGAV